MFSIVEAASSHLVRDCPKPEPGKNEIGAKISPDGSKNVRFTKCLGGTVVLKLVSGFGFFKLSGFSDFEGFFELAFEFLLLLSSTLAGWR